MPQEKEGYEKADEEFLGGILANAIGPIRLETHPGPEILRDYLFEEVDDGEVLAHIMTCTHCAVEVEKIRGELDGLVQGISEKPRKIFLERIRETWSPVHTPDEEVSTFNLATVIGEFLNTLRLPDQVRKLITEVSQPQKFELSRELVARLVPSLGEELLALYPLNEAVREQKELKFDWREAKQIDKDAYKLTVYDPQGSVVIASWEAAKPPSPYPDTAVPLQEGKDYSWYVEALKGGRPLLMSEPVAFRLLTQAQRQALEEQEKRWKALEAELHLVAGAFYESVGLYREAEERYRALVAHNDPRGYARLGRIYERKGLARQARECYERASALWFQE